MSVILCPSASRSAPNIRIIGSRTSDCHWCWSGRHNTSSLACLQASNACFQRLCCVRMYVFLVRTIGDALTRACIVTMSGLVFGAESALIEHENRRRREENILRREARLDLARRGLVGTETEIARWKLDRQEQIRQQSASRTPP